MGGKAEIKSCYNCKVTRPIRKCGLCYKCHWHLNVADSVLSKAAKLGHPVNEQVQLTDVEDAERNLLRISVREAANRLFASWRSNCTPEGLQRQEEAAWALIDAVEDLLGKE